MKTYTKLLGGLLFFAAVSFVFSSCRKNDSKPTPRSKTYQITAYGGSGVSGTAQFREILNADSVQVTVTLKGKDINNLVVLPVNIRKGTALEDGEVLMELGELEGNDGQGALKKDVKLSYDKLLDLDAGITVTNPKNGALIAQAEIGANDVYMTRNLTDGDKKPNGQFRIYQRKQGSYFVIKVDDIDEISSACKGHDHPARIYDATGDRDFELNPVSDESGISATLLKDQAYNELKKYKGSVKVLCSEERADQTIASGDF